MKRDEIRSMLPDELENVEEIVDNILNMHGDELNKTKNRANTKFEGAKAEIDELRKKAEELDAIKKEQMNAEERAEQAQKVAEELANELRIKNNTVDIERMFVEAGITDKEQYEPIIQCIVTSDEESSKKTANALISLMATQKEAIETSLKAELMKNVEGPKGGSIDGMTKDMFDNLTVDEQVKFIETNPDWRNIIKKG